MIIDLKDLETEDDCLSPVLHSSLDDLVFNQLDACCSGAYQGSAISKDSIAAHLLHKLLETRTILPRAHRPQDPLCSSFATKVFQ